MSRLALVFSGGGAKGAFGAGVLSELATTLPQLRWDIVTGTSTGALIAPFAALGRDDTRYLSLLGDFYIHARRDDIAKPLSLMDNLCGGAKGLSSLAPLDALIRKTFKTKELQALEASTVATIITAVNLQRGRLYLCTQDQFAAAILNWYKANAIPAWGMVPEMFPFSRFRNAMVASSAVPFAAEPIVIDGDQYSDGGVLDKAPLRAALAAGATHAIVIMMSPPPSEPKNPKPFKNIVAVGMRAIDLLQEEVARGDLESIETANRLQALSRGLGTSSIAPLTQLVAATMPYVAAGQSLRFAIIDPEVELGATMDFDSKVREGWPLSPQKEQKKIGIMEGRFNYGRRRCSTLLADQQSALRRLLHDLAAP